MALKEAALIAAGLCGQDGKGKGQLVGYMRMLAREEPAVFARLLERILPTQANSDNRNTKIYTAAEAAAHLRERGLPVPSTLTEAGSNRSAD